TGLHPRHAAAGRVGDRPGPAGDGAQQGQPGEDLRRGSRAAPVWAALLRLPPVTLGAGGGDTVIQVSDGPDLNPHNLLNIVLHHLEVPAGFVPGALLLGGAAWYLAPRRGWDRVSAVLAGCSLALALALTVVRPFGHFPAGGLNPLA